MPSQNQNFINNSPNLKFHIQRKRRRKIDTYQESSRGSHTNANEDVENSTALVKEIQNVQYTGFSSSISIFVVSFSCFVLLSFYSQVNAGLAVDHHFAPKEAIYGDICNVDMYNAYRVPLLRILVNRSGEYEEQQTELSTYSDFNYYDRKNKTWKKTSFIPKEHEHEICFSTTTPLMCKETNKDTGEGICVCLYNFTVNATKWKDGASIDIRNVTTEKVQFTLPFHHDKMMVDDAIWASKTGKRRRRADGDNNSNGSQTTNSETSSSTFQFFTTISTPKTSESSNNTDKDNGNEVTEEPGLKIEGAEARDKKEQRVQAKLKHVQCLAMKSTFCETPFISCLSFAEMVRGRNSTACIFSVCGGNSTSADLSHPILQHQLINTLLLLVSTPLVFR